MEIEKKDDKMEVEKKEEKKEEKKILEFKEIEGNSTAWYELCGVITHKGRSADSGHYVSWVKQNDNRWMCFDDDKVSEVTENDIKKLQGGGDWHCAYLLIYRSKNPKNQIVSP